MEKIYTENAPAAIGPYSQAVKANGMIYTSGQIAINPATGNIEAKDVQGQTEQVMQNLQNVLTAAGTDFSKVVKTTCFLADIADFGAFNEIYGKYITEKPARSCVAVKDLPKNALVEVEIIAIAE
ncbi:MAG: RidA family protein [Oscillospiraceae bacterium]|nr:RidA family protein [Oscillospiraceae bacterium]